MSALGWSESWPCLHWLYWLDYQDSLSLWLTGWVGYVCTAKVSRWIMLWYLTTGMAKFLEKVPPRKAKCCVAGHTKRSAVGRRWVPAEVPGLPQEKAKERTQLICFPYPSGLMCVRLSLRLIQGTTSGRKASVKWSPCQAKECLLCVCFCFIAKLYKNVGSQFLD